jgi:RNA recognition motif-containing protein
MRPKDSRSGRRSGRGSRRSSRPFHPSRASQPAARPGFWQRLLSYFRPAAKSSNGSQARSTGTSQPKPSHKPEPLEVTSAKLYIGNLSFDATESDLFELFNGVGSVRSAEIVTHRQTERSKGFAFVTMASVDEARRAVTELHDKDFMGRKLVVSGAKSTEHEPNYRG